MLWAFSDPEAISGSRDCICWKLLSVPIQANPVPMAELVGDVVNARVPEIYGETASVGSPYKLCDLGQFLNPSPSFLIFKMEITVHA